jgi:ABC transporter family protein
MHDKKDSAGNARIPLLVVLALVAGMMVSAFLLRHGAKPETADPTRNADTPPPVVLSDSTKAVLKRLNAPLEIRFYSSLDPASVSQPARAFAARAESVLDAFAQAAAGRITLNRFTSSTNFDANAALADGIKAFNIDKGDACFLGVAFALGEHKTALPRLAPEWEPALESDISRAILALLDAQAAAQPILATSPIDPATTDQLNRIIPDPSAVSLEQGKSTLREAALKQFNVTAQEMNRRVEEAQQRFIQAQKTGSEAEQQAARQQLQQALAEQAQKLDQVVAQAKAQMRAFERLKGPQ